MPSVSSCYWNNVHGSCPEDVQKDEEGLRTMRVLGRNMAWMLRCIAAGKAAGVPEPKQEPMEPTAARLRGVMHENEVQRRNHIQRQQRCDRQAADHTHAAA